VTAIGSATPTEITESKEIYRGFIALRLAAAVMALHVMLLGQYAEHLATLVLRQNSLARGASGGFGPPFASNCR
jgi:hypothetical protein